MSTLDATWAAQRILELEAAVDLYAAAKIAAEGCEIEARAELIATNDQLHRTEQLLVAANRRTVDAYETVRALEQDKAALTRDRVHLVNRLAHLLADKADGQVRTEQLPDGSVLIAGVHQPALAGASRGS